MSTIPLSAAPTYGQTLSGEPPAEIERDDGKLDDVINSAMEGHIDEVTDTIVNRNKIRERDDEPLPYVEGNAWADLVLDPDREAPAPREAGLEKIMRGRQEKLAAREIQTRHYNNAKPHFDECARMGVGPDVLLKSFSAWDERFEREGPEAAAYALAESAFRMAPHTIDVTSPRVDPDKELEQKYPDPLDRTIAKGFNAKDTREQYAKVMEAWDAIQAKYPHERLDDVVRRAVLTLKDLGRDPWQAAARVAAGKGLPVTPPAQAAAQAEQQEQARVAAAIEQGKTYMPNMQDQAYRHEMGAAMSQREFVASGNEAYDLERAYQIVEIKRQQPDNVRARIDYYGPSQPGYAEVRPYVEAVLRRRDLQFTYNTNTDAERVWQIAMTTMQMHQKQQRQKLSTLDGRISGAMAQHGMA